jgi:long-chain acyl-CoA synthetase
MFTYEKPDNLVELFENTVNKFPDNNFIGSKSSDGEYYWSTYSEVALHVDNLRGALFNVGVTKDDFVGIIANNRAEWAIGAFATYGLGARFVPMYESELEKLWFYIIKDSAVKVLIVSTREIYDKVAPFLVTIDTLERILIIEDDGPDSLGEFSLSGESKSVKSIYPSPHDIAGVVYTSGTTGDPKGVLLTHGNFTSNYRAGFRLFPEFNEESLSISILPWAHSYGQVAELYNFISFGGSIGIMGSVATLGADIATLRPTILIGVPRVFNKIYGGIIAKFDAKNAIIRSLFKSGIKNGLKKQKLEKEGKSAGFSSFKYSFVNKLIFSKIRKKLGGRVGAALTASAAMKPEVVDFFNALGIPLYDAYGLTECSPAVSMNCHGAFRVGSVGKALEFVDISIDKSVIDGDGPDGEIVVKGPNVMMGYHNKPKDTSLIKMEDGSIRTGDRGYLDEDGFLFITGRIKEQYKLQNGIYVFPSSLEEDIGHSKYIANAFVYGSGREYNVSIVVPNFDVLGILAKKENLPSDPDQLVKHPKINEFLMKQINKELLGKYGKYEIPRKIHLVTEDFTLENGVLTQTMKLKRRVLVEKYGKDIEEMYS